MSMTSKVQADARATLFEELDSTRVGMLGVVDSGQHMQPMTHTADANTAELWFISARQTDLVRAVGMGAMAHHCLVRPDGTFYACLKGPIEQVEDRARLDALWSTAAAAWFEDGREDPDIALLRLTLQEAAIWTATDSSLLFGIEIARATMNPEHKPDLGDHRVLTFSG